MKDNCFLLDSRKQRALTFSNWKVLSLEIYMDANSAWFVVGDEEHSLFWAQQGPLLFILLRDLNDMNDAVSCSQPKLANSITFQPFLYVHMNHSWFLFYFLELGFQPVRLPSTVSPQILALDFLLPNFLQGLFFHSLVFHFHQLPCAFI